MLIRRHLYTAVVGDATVRPVDIVFEDINGVLIIPRDREKEIIGLALEKEPGEKTVQKTIEHGMSAVEVFKTYGIM